MRHSIFSTQACRIVHFAHYTTTWNGTKWNIIVISYYHFELNPIPRWMYAALMQASKVNWNILNIFIVCCWYSQAYLRTDRAPFRENNNNFISQGIFLCFIPILCWDFSVCISFLCVLLVWAEWSALFFFFVSVQLHASFGCFILPSNALVCFRWQKSHLNPKRHRIANIQAIFDVCVSYRCSCFIWQILL